MVTVSSFSFCFLIHVRYLISLCLITYLKVRGGKTQRDIFRGRFKVIHEHGAVVFGSQSTMQCIKTLCGFFKEPRVENIHEAVIGTQLLGNL